jgi:hypothetical protein
MTTSDFAPSETVPSVPEVPTASDDRSARAQFATISGAAAQHKTGVRARMVILEDTPSPGRDVTVAEPADADR